MTGQMPTDTADHPYWRELAADIAAHGGLGDDPHAAICAAHDRRQAFAVEMLEGRTGRAKAAAKMLCAAVWMRANRDAAEARMLSDVRAIAMTSPDLTKPD